MNKKKQLKLIRLCFVVLLINFLIENSIFYFRSRDFIISFQIIVNAVYLIYSISTLKSFQFPNLAKYIIFIILFLLVMGTFSSSIIDTYNKILKFILPTLYFVVGCNLIKNKESLYYFINKLWLIQVIFIFSIIYANIFDIGDPFYRGGIKVGHLSINSLYTITFSWVFLLFFINKIELPKVFTVILLTVSFIIILLILKRTLILLLLISILLFVIQNLRLKSILTSIIIFSVGILIFQNYFSEYFEQSLEARSSRFSEEYSIVNEGRVQENVLPFIHMENSPHMYLVGTGEVFNDRPYHFKYLKIDRELHNSFVRIFWSGGLILLIFFLLFYYSQIKRFYKFWRNSKSNNEIKRLFYFGIIIVLLRFIGEFSSGITYMSYNIMCYLSIGGLIYIANKKTLENNKNENPN